MSRINSYQELVNERIRLQEQLKHQKTMFKAEVIEIKARLQPFSDFVSFLGIFNQKDVRSDSIMKAVMPVAIDLLGAKFMSGKNWIARFAVALIVKGIAGRLIVKKENQ